MFVVLKSNLVAALLSEAENMSVYFKKKERNLKLTM